MISECLGGKIQVQFITFKPGIFTHSLIELNGGREIAFAFIL